MEANNNNTEIQTEQTTTNNPYHQENKNYRGRGGRGGNYNKVNKKKLKSDRRKK